MVKGKTGKKTYRKKGYKKRSFNMTKRYSSPSMGRMKIMRWSVNDTGANCHLVRTGDDSVPTNIGVATFALNQVQSNTEITNLFDNYRITRVLYRWVVTRDPSQATLNKGWSVRVVWAHDFNDSNQISIANLYQRQGLREVYINSDRLTTKWYSLKPATVASFYESGVAGVAYSPKWGQWFDTSDNTTTHYGIKYGYDNLFAGMFLRMEAKVYMECKGIS